MLIFEKYKFKIPYIIQGESKFFNISVTVNEENVEGLPTQNESSIAVNPNNPNIVISSAVDYRDNSSTWHAKQLLYASRLFRNMGSEQK